jgi:hypothetical protein
LSAPRLGFTSPKGLIVEERGPMVPFFVLSRGLSECVTP